MLRGLGIRMTPLGKDPVILVIVALLLLVLLFTPAWWFTLLVVLASGVRWYTKLN